MSEAQPPIDPDEAMLSRLAALDLMAAEKVHGRLMAAEEPGEIVEFARAYQRMARSVRQTIMAKAKLARERAQAAVPAPAPASAFVINPDPMGIRTDRRAMDLQDAVGRVAAATWPDDRERQEALSDEFDFRLDLEVETPDFYTRPLHDHVRECCARLGLSDELAARWRSLPPAPLWPDDDPADETADPPTAEAPPPVLRADTG